MFSSSMELPFRSKGHQIKFCCKKRHFKQKSKIRQKVRLGGQTEGKTNKQADRWSWSILEKFRFFIVRHKQWNKKFEQTDTSSLSIVFFYTIANMEQVDVLWIMEYKTIYCVLCLNVHFFSQYSIFVLTSFYRIRELI
jgi:hypothetical protein